MDIGLFVFGAGLLVIVFTLVTILLGKLPYFKKRWTPKWEIVVAEESFALTKNEEVIVKILFSEIARLEVYKVDQMVVDSICCDIMLGTNDGDRMWTVNEEIPGFKKLMKSFEQLPGFNDQWFPAIVKPAFAENRTIIFDKASGKDFKPVW